MAAEAKKSSACRVRAAHRERVAHAIDSIDGVGKQNSPAEAGLFRVLR
jgi:hypothetical protein